MGVTAERWIGTKEDEKGFTIAYCTKCGGEEWTIGDIHHAADCLVPLVNKQAGIIRGHGEQVADLKAALTAARRDAAALREALQNIRDNEGKVCGAYEICDHVACHSSYSAWAIAAAAAPDGDEGKGGTSDA